MVKQNFFLLTPPILAAIICALLFYGGIVKTGQKNNFSSLLKTQDVAELCGTVIESPMRTKSGKFYKARCKTESATSSKNEVASCRGCITLFIPASQIECFFPGKFYTALKGKTSLYCETGTKLRAVGHFAEGGFFFADECTAIPVKNTPYYFICKIRALCRLQFRRLMFAWGNAGGLLLALLSGIREYTEPLITESFRNAGLSHILALSGMHLGLFSGLTRFFSDRTTGQKAACLIELTAVSLFVWFAGFSPSLYRAFVSALIGLVCRVFAQKRIKNIHILAIAFLFHSVTRPLDIHEVSFCLSYGALAGILVFSELLSFFSVKGLPGTVASPLCASGGAQLFSAPVTLKMLGTFAPIGVIASTVISPAVTVFIYTGLTLFVLCCVFPPLVPAANFILNAQYSVISKISCYFAGFTTF